MKQAGSLQPASARKTRHSRLLLAIFAWLILALPTWAVALTIASYNVENYHLGEGVSETAPLKSEKAIAALVSVIRSARPDILGIVEMGDRASLSDLQSRLKSVGCDYPYSEWVAGDDVRHVALLSRYPIVASYSRDKVPIELGGRAFLSPRGFLDVEIACPGQPALRLVGVHFKSRRIVPQYDQAQFRTREAAALRRHIAPILAAGAHLVVFGDLNDSKNSPAVQEVIGRGKAALLDARPTDTRREVWTYHWKTADEYSRIDYLLSSPNMLPRSAKIISPSNWRDASDHRMIVAVY